MTEKTNKSKENESLAIANVVAFKKDDGILSFEDNRPEAVAQRKLQKMIKSGAPLQQRNHAQGQLGQYDHAPIQRKPLKPGVLNVVGENHDTSDLHRAEEIKYTKEKTGGGYWEENKFKIIARKPGGKDLAFIHGDSKILQMGNIIQFNTQGLSETIRFLTIIGKVTASAINLRLNRQKVFSNTGLIQKHLPKLKAFGNGYKELKEEAEAELPYRPELQPVFDFYVDFGDPFYDQYVTGVDNWVQATNNLNKDRATVGEINAAVAQVPDLIALGDGLLVKMFEKDKVSYDEHKAAQDEVIMERSKIMHDSGTKGSGTKGVWKIGNQHVKDIKKAILKGERPAYELMTEAEFFEDFKKWLAEKKWVKTAGANTYEHTNAMIDRQGTGTDRATLSQQDVTGK